VSKIILKSFSKENQSGFRQSYSTLDNIFSIFTPFQILKSKKKKLYCAFIDFEKAFDRVWKDDLFHKLLLIEKRRRSKFSPCLTPVSQLKYPVV
jgi:hypothetical protein